MGACKDIFVGCDLFNHFEMSQPLARRITRAFSRKDLRRNTPYTATQLAQALEMYRSTNPPSAYSLAPIPMNHVRERLRRVEEELKDTGFISGIREVKVRGTAALVFQAGWRLIPEWK